MLEGQLTETGFESTPSGLMKPTVTTEMLSGGVCAAQDSDTHQVSNLQAAGVDLITLHIYSPPLLRMDTYSLTDATVGEFIPTILSHMDGSGI